MHILDEIIANKRKEIEELKPLSDIARFEKEGFFWNEPNISLVQNLLDTRSTGIIAEFKRKSPSKGWFKDKSLGIEIVAGSYNVNGAAGISVLTDEVYFGGSLDDLMQVKVITDIPVLRKDFMIDPWQVAEAKAFGADVILLIAACLPKNEVKQMAAYAKSLGLEVLLEIHNENELDHICDEVDMIGVNNRDLKTFKVDINTSLNLINKIPTNKPAIAESGISDAETIVTLKQAGFRGFLIGEMFMKEADPAIAFAGFVKNLESRFSRDL
ncbi:MAG TPA: indole-3-glycerol phosphate synthase TrpC [Chitinophagaceae bacterium]|nr:indole-3-glycerol phosphate synthase TrpC [Chitinophagaceae bacterium]